uniref:Secreted protein n=1 Tax=Caenorhabditis tropicalis TaxID=1561998 RepID=A0A1I7UPL3_9PELO
MWLTTLWILFSFLGASAANDGILQRGIISNSSSNSHEPIVKMFIKNMTDSIATRQPNSISALFDEGFFFYVCKRSFNKTQFVKMLSEVPKKTPVTITLKSIGDYPIVNYVKFFATVTGVAPVPLEVRFIISPFENQHTLSEASLPWCRLRPYDDFVREESPEVIYQKFMKRMIKTINSKDKVLISGLFEPDFTFSGCEEDYDKKEYISVLEELSPSVTNFSLVTYVDKGPLIQYFASIE